MCDLRESSICRSSSFRLAPSQCILGIEGGALGRAPGFWVCAAAPGRLQGAKLLTSGSQNGGKRKRKDFLKFFLPVPVESITESINNPTYFNCFPGVFPVSVFYVVCIFCIRVSHVNRIRSVEYFNYRNNPPPKKKKSQCCLFFSSFGGSASSRLPAGWGESRPSPLNTASATLEHGLRHSKRRREVKPRRRLATSSLMMGAPLTLHYPR